MARMTVHTLFYYSYYYSCQKIQPAQQQALVAICVVGCGGAKQKKSHDFLDTTSFLAPLALFQALVPLSKES
jgi:transcriptional regulatory protein LevR